MSIPTTPKIYHIVHVDRLASIIANGGLLCDAQVASQGLSGTTIGMGSIKHRRLYNLTLTSHPHLHVGDCVPFYFCPRSIMLYMMHQGNHPELGYRGGQEPIIHLQADLRASVAWAEKHQHRWAFTLTNAGSYFFEDRCDLHQLHELDWTAINAQQWQSYKDGKQAEFLIEQRFPWELVEAIGVYSQAVYTQVCNAIGTVKHRPLITIKRDWYY